MRLTIMTYNIQHGVDHARRLREPMASDVDLIDLDRFVQAIHPFQPDILSLNEVRDASFEPGFTAETKYMAGQLNMDYYYFAEALGPGERGPYGNALLSRYPFLSIEKIMIPDAPRTKADGRYETRCIIKAVVDTPDGPLHAMNTHFGLEPEEAENAVKTVLSHTDASKPGILMGDFNVTPDSPILKPLLEVYHDSGVLLPADTLTYPSDAPEMKIDYILGCGPVRFLKAEVPQMIVSDHFPYVTQIL